LTPVAGSPFAAGTDPISIAVDAEGKFAFVANEGSGNVSAYTLNAATGALTAVSGSPYAVKTGPSSVAVDPSGKYVYVANYWSTNISAFSVKSTTGTLTEITGSPFAGETNAGGNPAAIAVVRIAL